MQEDFEEQGFTYNREVHRGEVYYMLPKEVVGNEQSGGRPIIVVSNEACNSFAGYVSGVCVTTKDKKPLPTHVVIPEDAGIPIKGTILGETVQQISKLRLGNYLGEIPEDLLKKVTAAIATQLDIPVGSVSKSKEEQKPVILEKVVERPISDAATLAEVERLKVELVKAQEREKVFKELYQEALKGGT